VNSGSDFPCRYDEPHLTNQSSKNMFSSKTDILFDHALRIHTEGKIEFAIKHYKDILALDRNHADALHHLGLAYLQLGDPELATSWIRKSIESNPVQINALSNLGYCLNISGKFEEALSFCEKACKLDSNNDGAWTNLGNAQKGLGLFKAAEISYLKALSLKPSNSSYLFNLGCFYLDQEQYKEASDFFKKAITINGYFPEALYNLAACLIKLQKPEVALKQLEILLNIAPRYAEGWNSQGAALNLLRSYEDALKSFDQSISIKPDYAAAWFNRGIALSELRRHEEALSSYRKAVQLNPNNADSWTNQGNALYELKFYEQALLSYQHSLKLKPRCAETLANCAATLCELNQFEEAISHYRSALKINPKLNFVKGDMIHTQMKICDWSEHKTQIEILEKEILGGKKASSPFAVIGLNDSACIQKLTTQIFVEEKLDFTREKKFSRSYARKEKIRVGYFSPDFREHPVSHLTAELFEFHNRDHFEIFGFSFGVNTQDPMRQRMEKAFDSFFDVRQLNDLEVALLASQLEIDIAIDLAGHTKDARPQIFAYRAAPIQMNFLGYPGTYGHPCMDYILGDEVSITRENRKFFAEKIIFLPDTFQVNPSHRTISAEKPPRSMMSLPDHSVVFCCFNSTWKITPYVFDCWVRILKAVENSVLWLSETNVTAKKNLHKNFEVNGIKSERLIFAERVDCLADHLARLRNADLFLDTFPYGAHSTASDVLWSGLPLITRAGVSFASRVATSLLNTIGLPQLSVSSADEYESLAIDLGRKPEELRWLRSELMRLRLSTPLFDTKLFCRHLETAYQLAHSRFSEGMIPDDIYIIRS